MRLTDIYRKVLNRWKKFRLQPIRVFCFHQVSDTFDESYMERIDWLETDVFKQRIEALRQEGYVFLSLPEAHEKLKHNLIRCKKYAVLTADDGWATLKNVLPWLNEQHIPVTLFLNPAYLDGKHYRDKMIEKYLSQIEVESLYEKYPLVTIGSHGWEHIDATKQTAEDFSKSVEQSVSYFQNYPNFINYYAYTWGNYNSMTNKILSEMKIIPLRMNGERNYNLSTHINRELLQ